MSVAVISTCFNQQDLIGDAIESVMRQTTAETVYHVICDDGSDDDSPMVLRQWEAAHDHITVVEVTNRTVAGALNAALLNVPADTEWVVVLAGDDFLADNYIEECLNAVGDADIVITGMRRTGYEGHDPRDLHMPAVRNPTVDELWAWEFTYAWAVSMIRMSSVREAGGFHPLTEGDSDWDLWIDLAMRGCTFSYTDKTWFFYRYVATSLNRAKTAELWDSHRREMMRHFKRDTLPGPEFS